MEDLDAIYVGNTRGFQHNEVKTIFEENPWLLEDFGEQWCNTQLLFEERRPLWEVHELFFRFGPLGRGRYFVDNLKLFKQTVENTRYIGFVNKLKRDVDNVAANINNLNAYCYLHQRGMEPEWEPPMPPDVTSTKRPDLGIPHQRGRIYTEVMTIRASEKDNERSDKIDALRAKVNQIPGISHDVVVSMGLGFQLEDLDALFEFIKSHIESGKLPSEPSESIKHKFEVSRRPIAAVRFSKAGEGRQGMWMGGGGPAMARMDSDRARQKLLAKLYEGKFQLPPKPTIGGFMVCLDDHYMSFRDVVDAIKGREGFAFSVTGDTKSMRFDDGVIHNPKGQNMIDVDFVIVVDRTQEKWNEENIRLIMNTESQIPRDEIENIFIVEESEYKTILQS